MGDTLAHRTFLRALTDECSSCLPSWAGCLPSCGSLLLEGPGPAVAPSSPADCSVPGGGPSRVCSQPSWPTEAVGGAGVSAAEVLAATSTPESPAPASSG